MKLRRRKVADATRDDSKPRYAAWTTYSTAVRQIITAPRRSIRAASLFSTAASTVAPSSHGKAISHPHTKSREPTKATTRAGVDENAHKRRAQGLTPGPLFLIPTHRRAYAGPSRARTCPCGLAHRRTRGAAPIRAFRLLDQLMRAEPEADQCGRLPR